MKRKWFVGIIASVVAVGGAIGASAFSDSVTSPNKKQEVEIEVDDDAMVALDSKTLLSVEELFEIVLGEVDGTIEEIELEANDKNYVYFEVEVKEKGKEYKVYVDAYSGKVLDVKLDDDDDDYEKRQAKDDATKEKTTEKNNDQLTKTEQPTKQVTVETKQTEKPKNENNVKKETKTEKKVEQSKPKAETTKKPEQNKSTKSNGIISQEEAIRIALSMANGKVTEVELDEDDGRLEYEIEIDLPNGQEAEVNIDAHTGKVIEFELDD